MVFIPAKINRSVLRNLIISCLILLVILALFPIDLTAQMELAWDPNTERDVVGYRIYYGTASRTYQAPINVGNVTTYTLNGLNPGVLYYIAITAYDTDYYESDYSNEVSGMITEIVSTPNVLSGPTTGIRGRLYSYRTGGSTSSLGDRVEYQFDWKGDGRTNLSTWGSATRWKTWTAAGTYNVRARARSAVNKNAISNWLSSLSVTISAPKISKPDDNRRIPTRRPNS